MNYLAHAMPFLDDPYFAVGTGVPDWLSVVDRQVRLRPSRVEAYLMDADARTAAVARGVMQHIRDDRRFHQSRAFAEVSLALTTLARDALDGCRSETTADHETEADLRPDSSPGGLQYDPSFRPAFLGHLLVEVLLDASLAAERPSRVDAYYAALQAVDAAYVGWAIDRMASRDCQRLPAMIWGFCRERILSDYLEDAKLLGRLNQVMRRVRFARLPDAFGGFLPKARRLVDTRREELLDGIPA